MLTWTRRQSPCDKTQKLKLWENSKTQIVRKLKNSNCDESQKLEIVTKLKNLNCDKTQKLKNSNSDNTQELKLWQYQENLKTQNVTKLFLYNFCCCCQNLCVTFLCYTIVVTYLNKNKLTHWQLRDVFRAAFCDTHNVLKLPWAALDA